VPRPEADWVRAEKLFRSRQFSAAAEAYRACLYQVDDNGPVFSRLGVCHLMRTDLGQAEHWFERVLDLDPRNPVALAGQAYIDLVTDRERSALYKYSVLVKDGWQARRIRELLEMLRTAPRGRDWALAQPMALFLPGPEFPKPWPRRAKLVAALGGAVLLSVAALIALLPQMRALTGRLLSAHSPEIAAGGMRTVYPPPQAVKPAAPVGKTTEDRIREIYLFDGLSNADRKLSSAAMVELFEDTKRSIARGRINQARINVNRVLQSDANLLLKEKFRLLEAAIPDPTFGSFANTMTVSEAVRDAACARTWFRFAGTAGSPRTAGSAWLFDFTFADGNETWTAEVLLEKTPGVQIAPGNRYVLLLQYRGFEAARKKPQFSAAVVKEIVLPPR
jgi:tetratricopeptide (TPR) repeat protein